MTSPTYEVRSPVSAEPERSEYFRQPPARTSTYPLPSSSAPYPQDDHYDSTRNDYKDYGRSDYPSRMPAMPDDDFADLAYGDVSSPNGSRQHSYSSAYPPHDPYATQMPAYPRRPEPPASGSRTSSYSHDRGYGSREESYSSKSQYESRGLRSDESLSKYESRDTKPQYDSRDVKPQYDSRDSKSPYDSRDVKPQYESRMPQSEDRSHDPRHDSARRAFSYDSYGRDANVVEMVPKGDKDSKSKSSRLSIDNRSGAPDASRSLGVSTRMERLSVSGNRPDLSGAGDLPPPSPLLEAYHGTYQQLSPMPSAMRSFEDDDELDMLEPLSPSTTRGGSDKLAQDAEKKKKKSVKVDNYEEDAERILKALQKSRVDTATLCEIIPALTHDQIIHVRREYKKQVKVQGKGVNLAKHIKTKLSGNLGKAAYVTALGRWESEGYWANFFYQSHGSRRELLIESLMGRTNREILEIKEEFRDKKYSDDLVKCMERELKMDKFRVAVLMALEGRRQEEQDIYPQEYRNRDVQTLHKALTAKQGGESVMLEIIVRRSDAHLREVMKTYDRMFQDNFPRAALKKSSNLVVSFDFLCTMWEVVANVQCVIRVRLSRTF